MDTQLEQKKKRKVAIAFDIDKVLFHQDVDQYVKAETFAQLLNKLKELANTVSIELHFFILSNRPHLNIYDQLEIDDVISELILANKDLCAYFNGNSINKTNLNQTDINNKIYLIGPNACKITFGLNDIMRKLGIDTPEDVWLIDDNITIGDIAEANNFTMIRCDQLKHSTFKILHQDIIKIFTAMYIDKFSKPKQLYNSSITSIGHAIGGITGNILDKKHVRYPARYPNDPFQGAWIINNEADKESIIKELKGLIKDPKNNDILHEVIYLLFFIGIPNDLYTSSVTIQFMHAMLYFIRHTPKSDIDKAQLFHDLMAFVTSLVTPKQASAAEKLFASIKALHKPNEPASAERFLHQFKLNAYVLAYSFTNKNITKASLNLRQLCRKILQTSSALYCPNSPYLHQPTMTKVILGCVISLIQQEQAAQSGIYTQSNLVTRCNETLRILGISLDFSKPDSLIEYTSAYENYLKEKVANNSNGNAAASAPKR